MRYPVMLLIPSLCALLAAAAQPPVRAQLDPAISIVECLSTIDHPNTHAEARCPGFIPELLKQARQTCTDAGGRLVATPASNVWSLDVNGDGAPEYAFEYDGNVSCEDAWSVFECGSLGCAKALYQKHDGAWRAIAEIWADALESIELTDVISDAGYRDLRVGCSGSDPCPEYWYYHWTGAQYDRAYLEANGHRVEFADSIHGLYGLVGAIDVLDAPAKSAASVGHYDSETEVEIVGTATGADFYYVSPCNACESGFVPKSSVRRLPP